MANDRAAEASLPSFSRPTAPDTDSPNPAADPMLDRLAELIRERKPFPQPKVSAADKIKSGVVNKAFYPLLVHAKQFTVNEKCTGCGLCAKLCPTCAITLHDGHLLRAELGGVFPRFADLSAAGDRSFGMTLPCGKSRDILYLIFLRPSPEKGE